MEDMENKKPAESLKATTDADDGQSDVTDDTDPPPAERRGVCTTQIARRRRGNLNQRDQMEVHAQEIVLEPLSPWGFVRMKMMTKKT